MYSSVKNKTRRLEVCTVWRIVLHTVRCSFLTLADQVTIGVGDAYIEMKWSLTFQTSKKYAELENSLHVLTFFAWHGRLLDLPSHQVYRKQFQRPTGKKDWLSGPRSPGGLPMKWVLRRYLSINFPCLRISRREMERRANFFTRNTTENWFYNRVHETTYSQTNVVLTDYCRENVRSWTRLLSQSAIWWKRVVGKYRSWKSNIFNEKEVPADDDHTCHDRLIQFLCTELQWRFYKTSLKAGALCWQNSQKRLVSKCWTAVAKYCSIYPVPMIVCEQHMNGMQFSVWSTR